MITRFAFSLVLSSSLVAPRTVAAQGVPARAVCNP